jgi:hypothetical protein
MRRSAESLRLVFPLYGLLGCAIALTLNMENNCELGVQYSATLKSRLKKQNIKEQKLNK